MARDPLHVLASQDPEAFAIAHKELRRQVDGLELIASENFVSRAVMAAAGSPFTNKYAEGYPGKRWYGGCEIIDGIENLAIMRAKRLFGARHANVQPHSGSQANQSAILAVADPGDTILSMRLDHGGHLSHGAPVNGIGQHYRIVHYEVGTDGRIDYDSVRDLALEHRPRIIIAGGSAYPRDIDFRLFREIADESGSLLLADIAHTAGTIAAGLAPSPINHAHMTTTTTHKTLRGIRGGLILLGRDYEFEVSKKSGFRYPKTLQNAIDSAVFPGTQGGPLEHIIYAKAVGFGEALDGERVSQEFILYQKNVIDNAQALASGLMERGYELSSGGTDNHLVLVVRPNDLTGKCADLALYPAGITTNKNAVPNDTESPFVAGGVRLGTPAVTTRGLDRSDLEGIAEIISDVWDATSEGEKHMPVTPEDVLAGARERVSAICDRRPLYAGEIARYEHIL